MEADKASVAIYDYDEIVKLEKKDDKEMFPNLCKEVMAQQRISRTMWYSLSPAAFEEYREYFEWQKRRGVFRSDAEVLAVVPPGYEPKVGKGNAV